MLYTVGMARARRLKKISENESFYQEINESAPFGLFVSDTAGDCIYANGAYLRLTGLAAAEIFGTGWALTIHPDDRLRVLGAFHSATGNKTPFSCEYRILMPDGSPANILLRAAPIYRDARVTGFVGAVEDITLRLKMENQLRINFAAMESSTGMIMITDGHGLITWVNPAFLRGTGYSFDEVVGKNPQFLSSSPDSPVKQALQQIISTGQPWKGEVHNRRKDGSVFLEEEIITPIIGTDGKISHFLAIKRDITEERENERKLAEYSGHLEELVKERTRELEAAQKRILGQLQLEQELKIAAQIQLSLLPERPPAVPEFDIASRAFAAHYISGDLYDFVVKNGKNLFILMADISGKGIPAALLAASARITVREKIQLTDSPAEILDLVNRTLYADLEKTEMFITMILARIDTETGLCAYSNAGHTRTMHCHAESRATDLLGPTSLPIGVFADLSAGERLLQLESGDLLFLYSDGLTEAASRTGDLFGEDALAEAVAVAAEQPSARIIDDLLGIIDAFSGHALPDDDRTAIVIKRLIKSRNQIFTLGTRAFEEIISITRRESLVFGDTFVSEIELVMTELLTNIIRHAYGTDFAELDAQGRAGAEVPTVEIRFLAGADCLTIDLYDRGKAFDPSACAEPDPLNLQVGGYGCLLIRKLTGTAAYSRESDNRNHWHLEKRRMATE